MNKKIALVTTKQGVVSGVTIIMDQLAKGLRARGFDVEQIRPFPTKLAHIKNMGYILSYTFLREELAKFDIILGNGVGLAGALDLPVTLIDTIHSTASGANRALEDAYANLQPEERQPLEYLLSYIAQSTITDLPASFANKASAFEIDKLVAQHAQKVVTVSNQVTQEVEKYFGVPRTETCLIPNAVADFWFETGATPADKPGIVCSGRAGYTPINIFLKGMDRSSAVLDAFPEARRLCMFHIGRDDLIPVFHELLHEKGVEHYFNLSQPEMASHLLPGDIFLNPSRYESFGLSVVEAMAAGLVPVTYATGIVPDLIKDGENGFIVSTIPELKEKVGLLLADKELSYRMGQAAKAAVRRQFTEAVMVEQYAALINSL